MNRAEIPIDSPCAADWSTMTLADRGRFCAQCKKVVRELAQMTEAEARALLASPPTEGLCVRYVHDATGEIVFRAQDAVVPATRLARAKRAAAVALASLALPLSTAACMGAAPPPRMGAVAAPPPTASTAQPVVVTMGAVPPSPLAPTAVPTVEVAK